MVGRRSPTRRGLGADETSLWEDFTRSIKPLRHAKRAAPAEKTKTKEEEATFSLDQESAVALAASIRSAGSGKPAAPPLTPLGRRARQRIARGAHTIDARLDLHGLTQAKAHAALGRFLRSAQADGAKLVLVITGKGGRPGDAERDRGVLRRQVPRWLAQPEFRGYVVGFETAHIGHGGEGALYIRIRRPRA